MLEVLAEREQNNYQVVYESLLFYILAVQNMYSVQNYTRIFKECHVRKENKEQKTGES